jgi:MFS family permease
LFFVWEINSSLKTKERRLKMEKRIIRLYLVIVFLFNLAMSFFFATYVVFLVSKGLDLLQVNLINCFYMAGVFLLEMPTGAFADLIGRKRSFVISCFCFSLSMFVCYLSETFWVFVLAELMAAVAASFYSGSFKAWIVDSLKHCRFKGDLNDVFSKEEIVKPISVAIGSLAGAYIGTIDLALPWLCASISMILVGIFSCLTMKEEYVLRGKSKFTIDYMISNMREIIIESVRYGIRKKSVLYIICFGMVFFFVIQALNMQWQVMFKGNFNLTADKLGWIFIGVAAFTSFGSYLSGWFLRICRNEKEAVVLSQIVTAIGILVASQCDALVLVLSSFLFHEIGRGVFKPLGETYINKRIPSEQRATILSFDSMMTMIGSVLGLVVSGWLAREYSISISWFISGIVLSIAIPIFLKIENGE